MKTKFKDFLLYSFACIGAGTLLLSVYQPTETKNETTVPESHVWTFSDNGVGIQTLNKVTGEVRIHNLTNKYYMVSTEFKRK
jgi:hypothetical protein